MVGGGQTVSIGRGCEQMATVQHEMMHAIGVWHEQSRADRDDYVDIVWSDITPGQYHNFFKYTFNETNDRRVPYDFNSVMHYDKTAFTANGNATIQTRDPAFEDVIGQRSTFSSGDVTKIQRMYECSDTLRVSYSVNFEQESVGGYSQYNTGGDVEWLRHDVAASDASGATTKYLPKFDSTLGVTGYGSYIYLDTSVKIPGLAGTIKSMRYRTTVAHQCLEFSYFMDVTPGSQAAMTVYVANIDETTGEIISNGMPLQTYTGSYGTGWNVQRMTISAPSTYRIVFTAKTGGYSADIIAIDDVSVVDKECDTSYFIVPDYSNILATYELDTFFVSPTMYTGTPGYAFQLLVYPTGTSTSGVMGIYFRLVGGEYDDQLTWPFDKQFIRFVITDQGPNPLTRMNYYYNFLTDASSILLGSSWDKPTGLGEANAAVGYGSFMNNDKLFTRAFMKHDSVYFSVQVTDMRPFDGGSTDISAQLTNPVLRSARDKSHEPDQDSWEQTEIMDAEEEEDGMIPVGIAAIIILSAAGGVFLVMSVVICVVAQSHRSRLANQAMVMNNFRAVGGLQPGQTVQYSGEKCKI